MDFEVSCWSTGPLTNAGQTFYNCDNPVQRRPKIDYFDSSTIAPIVSHISSNGYYGYCPTTNVQTSFAEQRSTAKDVSNAIVPMESIDTEQFQHQGRSTFENRKRAIHCIADDFAEQDAKRRRSHLSVIDYVEGKKKKKCVHKYISIKLHANNHLNCTRTHIRTHCV